MTTTFMGHAIVSMDGFIADDHGRMPDALCFPSDRAHFQKKLDAADIILLGRHTHEAMPPADRRRRLVVSRGVRAVIQENASTWWVNPREVAPASAVAVVAGTEAAVAVIGGTGVFSWILAEAGYDDFGLSIAHRVRLGAGRSLIDGVDDLDGALSKLKDGDLHIRERSWLDETAALEHLTLGPGTGPVSNEAASSENLPAAR